MGDKQETITQKQWVSLPEELRASILNRKAALPPGLLTPVQQELSARTDEPAAPTPPITLPARVPNKTELRYENTYLKAQLIKKEIAAYSYETLTLILYEALPLKGQKRTRYTPDWHVILPDGRTRFVEVKGKHVFDGAIEKLKSAAKLYPAYEFFLAQWKHGEWTIARVPSS